MEGVATRDLTDLGTWDEAWRRPSGRSAVKLSTRDFDRYMAGLLARVPPRGRVLELGGAPGDFVLRYWPSRRDLTWDCIDFSPLGVERTCARYAAAAVTGRVVEGDVRRVEQGEASYDLVYSNGLVEHFEDPDEMIRHHFRFARVGGWVSITVPNYATFPVENLLRRFSRRTIETHNLRCMDPTYLRGSLERAGLGRIDAGGMGSAILPNSSPDASWGGRFYRRLAQGWNLSQSLLGVLTRDRLVLRWWSMSLYAQGQRRVTTAV